MINHSSRFAPFSVSRPLRIQPHASTPSGSRSQRKLRSGEAGGPPQEEESAGGLLQADRARRAGDERGGRGLHVLHEGEG